MKTKIHRFIAMIGCCVWLTSGISAEPLADSRENGFAVRVATNKKVSLLGEPVILTITIEYKGKEAIEVTHPLDCGEYDEVVEIASKEKGEFHRYLTPAEAFNARIDRSGPIVKIKFVPGQKVGRIYDILCWPSEHFSPDKRPMIFPQLGEYFIRFTVVYKNRKYSSTVSIEVEAPATEVNKNAWALIGNEETIFFIQRASFWKYYAKTENQTTVQRCRELLEKYPDSGYTPLVKDALDRYEGKLKPKTNRH